MGQVMFVLSNLKVERARRDIGEVVFVLSILWFNDGKGT
jgi:hypothetical protein